MSEIEASTACGMPSPTPRAGRQPACTCRVDAADRRHHRRQRLEAGRSGCPLRRHAATDQRPATRAYLALLAGRPGEHRHRAGTAGECDPERGLNQANNASRMNSLPQPPSPKSCGGTPVGWEERSETHAVSRPTPQPIRVLPHKAGECRPYNNTDPCRGDFSRQAARSVAPQSGTSRVKSPRQAFTRTRHEHTRSFAHVPTGSLPCGPERHSGDSMNSPLQIGAVRLGLRGAER